MDKQKILEMINAELVSLQGLEYAFHNDDLDIAMTELSNIRRELLHLYLMVVREKDG